MTTRNDQDALDDCFALIGENVDFIGDIVRRDQPAPAHRWTKSDSPARTPPPELWRRGRTVMQQLGLIRVNW